jgi:hypothetical protein
MAAYAINPKWYDPTTERSPPSQIGDERAY